MVQDEILKFRHTHKERESRRMQDKEKKRDKIAKEKLEREKNKTEDSDEGKSSKSRRRSHSPRKDERKRKDSTERDSKSNRIHRSREREEREKEREREREREREKEKERKERERERERLKLRERRIRSLSRSRRRSRSRSSSERLQERRRLVEKDEESEKRKFEKKQKELKLAFEKALKNWDSRERKKSKEIHKRRDSEITENEEMKRETKKLAKFLAEYDDEHDDPKYYKGGNYARRRRDRAIESQEDSEDRQREKTEISEKKELEVHDRSYSRGSISMSQSDSNHMDTDSDRPSSPDRVSDREESVPLEKTAQPQFYYPSTHQNHQSSLPTPPFPKQEVNTEPTAPLIKTEQQSEESRHQSSLPPSVLVTLNKPLTHEYPTPDPSDTKPSPQQLQNFTPGKLSFDLVALNKLKLGPKPTDAGRKRAVDLAFGVDEEPELEAVPISKFPKQIPPEIQMDMSFPPLLPADSAIGRIMNEEEKKKQTKKLISSIPTCKEEVFKYDLSWAMIDKSMMDKRIRPWINKKIVDYIGEEEQALVDFIIEKLQEQCSAQSLLQDIVMVLDDDAEMFVVKMWRLMIYESEARKLGICKY
eukprot:TRINITY_DN994_c0_g1_i3.p1 TRINITY_DN994_c0_g1~~TRINITY_DN994_c0_g1_i3.p1  ORF type:complete len:592 (+),score=177.37 TRINITY_DN994_c0_g1_i3:358-2133(+)